MNRVQIFRQKRSFRRKVKTIIFIFLFFIIAGIAIVDYSVNSLMKDEKRIELMTLNNSSDYYVIDLLGKKLYFNIGRIKKDYGKVKSMIKNITG